MLNNLEKKRTKTSLRACLSFLCALTFFSSCKVDKETTVANSTPITFLSVDTIELNGPNRLITKVKLNWAGTDQDGFVVGFKIAWDQNQELCKQKLLAASPVARTDSTFLFNFSNPDGADTADIFFMVQAIDNKGLTDPNPKTLKIPVRNSAPVIKFLADGLPDADTIFSVFSFPYSFSDPDGEDNVDSIFIKINDGNWTALPKNINFISLVPQDPMAFGQTNALVFAGNGLATENQEPKPLANVLVPGLQINGQNRIYLRIKDLAGAQGYDTTKTSYYFKRKTSDLLIVDAYNGDGAFIGDSMYYNMIGKISSYDRLDLIGNNGKNRPKFWSTTFYLQTSLYKKVFWYSDIFSTVVNEVPLLMTYAVPALTQYLRFNGKLMASMIFPDFPTQISNTDPVFSLIPVDSITSLSRDVRLRRDSLIFPKQSGFPELKTTGFLITGVDLFYPKPGVDTLYFVDKNRTTNLYTGPGLPIALRTKNPFSDKTNLVFFGMELTYLSGDRQALQNLFSKVLNEEFNW